MDIEQALNRVVKLALKWQQSHEWAAAFKAADRFREYRDKCTERFDELSEEKHAHVITAHGEFIAMENLLRQHAPQFLELVPGVNFFTDSATDHSQQIRNVKKLEGAVRMIVTESGNDKKPPKNCRASENDIRKFDFYEKARKKSPHITHGEIATEWNRQFKNEEQTEQGMRQAVNRGKKFKDWQRDNS